MKLSTYMFLYITTVIGYHKSVIILKHYLIIQHLIVPAKISPLSNSYLVFIDCY